MQVPLSFPAEFVSADALQRALYRVADEASWDVRKDNETWFVTIEVQDGIDSKRLESTFKQHVIDYGLRERIRGETEHVRALLLAHAFSAAAPVTETC